MDALEALLKQHAHVVPGQFLAGVHSESASARKPYRSVIRPRRDGFEVRPVRHATWPEATLRLLSECQRFYAAPPPKSTAVAGWFMLAQNVHVGAEAMGELVAAAREAVRWG